MPFKLTFSFHCLCGNGAFLENEGLAWGVGARPALRERPWLLHDQAFAEWSAHPTLRVPAFFKMVGASS